jgi:hypothetical protein
MSTSFTSPIDSLLALTTVVPISFEASQVPACCCVMKWSGALPLWAAAAEGGEVDEAEPLAPATGLAAVPGPEPFGIGVPEVPPV